jgi:hypothetical protein
MLCKDANSGWPAPNTHDCASTLPASFDWIFAAQLDRSVNEFNKLPTVMRTPSGDMRKLWEAFDQAIFGVDGGYVLVPDHQRPWSRQEVVAFTAWDDVYYCLMGEHWQETENNL